jgi:hypothetical protein
MDDIPTIEILIENLSLETKVSKAFESNGEKIILNLQNYMLKDCSRSLKGDMPFVGHLMW